MDNVIYRAMKPVFVSTLLLLLSACSSVTTTSNHAVLQNNGQQQQLRMAQKAERSGFIQLAIDMHKSQLERGNGNSNQLASSRVALFWLYRQAQQDTRALALLSETERLARLDDIQADGAAEALIQQRFNGLMNWRCIRAAMAMDAMSAQTDSAEKPRLKEDVWHWLNQAPALDNTSIQPSLRHCYPLQARLLNQRGQQQQAHRLYQRLLLSDPEYWPHRYNLALSYVLQHKNTQAQALLLPGCSQGDCPLPLRQLLALSYGLQDQRQQTLKWMEPLRPAQQQRQLAAYQQWQQRLQPAEENKTVGKNAAEKNIEVKNGAEKNGAEKNTADIDQKVIP